MEIVDCYCGIGPWQKRDRLLPCKPGETLELMDHCGVSRALVHSNFTSGGGACLRGNEHLREACRNEPRFLPAFTIAPFWHHDEPTVEEQCEAMRQAESRALWFLPTNGYGRTWLYGDILAACARRRIPVFVSRDRLGPEDVNSLLTELPDLRLVLCSVGYMDDWWLYPLMKRHANLFVSSGHYYFPTYNPMRFLKTFSADRLLFGSGLPHFSPGGMVAHFMYADIADADREHIMAGNLLRLLEEVRS
jgi:predicted TIM-barrel fold metal-dependent hydrolase